MVNSLVYSSIILARVQKEIAVSWIGMRKDYKVREEYLVKVFNRSRRGSVQASSQTFQSFHISIEQAGMLWQPDCTRYT